MRIIPRKTKVSTEFFKGVSLVDMAVGGFGVMLVFFIVLSSLPHKLGIICGIFFVFAILLVRIDEEPNYMFILRILKHLFYNRHYKKNSLNTIDKKNETWEATEEADQEYGEETEEELGEASEEATKEPGTEGEDKTPAENKKEAEDETREEGEDWIEYLEDELGEASEEEAWEISSQITGKNGKRINQKKENRKETIWKRTNRNKTKQEKTTKKETTPKKTKQKQVKQKKIKQKKNQDIHRMTLIQGIYDNQIDYGSYYGAVVEIPPVEFRFFSEHRRSNAIDSALGNVIRSVSSHYAANMVKIERPMILDEYIQSEYEKIDMLRKSYENGVFSEEELKVRIELIYDRLDKLEDLNEENQVLVPHYYLVFFDSDKRQLENQMNTVISTLQTGEMNPKRLNDKELAVFLRYTNSVDFDEREIENLDPSEYVDFLLPDTLDFKQKTVEVNHIITHNFRVQKYPLDVGDAWGARLFDIPGTKVVVKFTQMDRDKSIRAIDRSIGELNSQLDKTGVSSKVLELQTHIETLSELLVMLQNNNETLMAMNYYVTAYDIAATRESKSIVQQPPVSVLPRISGMKKDVKRTYSERGLRLSDQSFQQLETFVAGQVNGYDPFVRQARGVPGSTIAGLFPWIYASIRDEKGVCLGSCDGVPTFFNFFRRDNERVNSNMVIVGKSGGGKSFATKSILANLAADDSKIFVLDPENEYGELAENLSGKFINVANASHGRINPFQIITSLEDDEAEEGVVTNSFVEHLQFLEEFFRQILPEVNADAMEYLNNLINRVYLRKGIDQYTNLSTLKATDYPTFDDLYDCILEEFQTTKSDYLMNNLRVLMSYVAKFSTGGRNSSIWNGHSTLSTAENFIVFNFQTLLANRNNTIANAQMLLVLKYLDNEIIKNREYNTKYKANRKIIIVIDEAHVFIDSKFPLALDFMYQLAKRIRKYNGMQIVITQNIKDFVGSEELARKSTAIINACQYSFIFSLAPNDMHDLCTLYEKAGGISELEQEQIMAAPRGRAFVVTGPTSRATLQIETPDPIREIFSERDCKRHYFVRGDSPQWEQFLGESRAIRQKKIEENKVTGEVNNLSLENDEMPDFRDSGVQLIEIEQQPETEEVLLIEEEDILLDDSSRKEEERKKAILHAEGNEETRTNATMRALDLLGEAPQPAAGVLSPGHLQQLGFEALVSQIRLAMKEELKSELKEELGMLGTEGPTQDIWEASKQPTQDIWEAPTQPTQALWEKEEPSKPSDDEDSWDKEEEDIFARLFGEEEENGEENGNDDDWLGNEFSNLVRDVLEDAKEEPEEAVQEETEDNAEDSAIEFMNLAELMGEEEPVPVKDNQVGENPGYDLAADDEDSLIEKEIPSWDFDSRSMDDISKEENPLVREVTLEELLAMSEDE